MHCLRYRQAVSVTAAYCYTLDRKNGPIDEAAKLDFCKNHLSHGIIDFCSLPIIRGIQTVLLKACYLIGVYSEAQSETPLFAESYLLRLALNLHVGEGSFRSHVF